MSTLLIYGLLKEKKNIILTKDFRVYDIFYSLSNISNILNSASFINESSTSISTKNHVNCEQPTEQTFAVIWAFFFYYKSIKMKALNFCYKFFFIKSQHKNRSNKMWNNAKFFWKIPSKSRVCIRPAKWLIKTAAIHTFPPYA